MMCRCVEAQHCSELAGLLPWRGWRARWSSKHGAQSQSDLLRMMHLVLEGIVMVMWVPHTRFQLCVGRTECVIWTRMP